MEENYLIEKGYYGILIIRGPARYFDIESKNPNVIEVRKWMTEQLESFKNNELKGIACPDFFKVEIIPTMNEELIKIKKELQEIKDVLSMEEDNV